jgi:hypothetical protein
LDATLSSDGNRRIEATRPSPLNLRADEAVQAMIMKETET